MSRSSLSMKYRQDVCLSNIQQTRLMNETTWHMIRSRATRSVQKYDDKHVARFHKDLYARVDKI